MRVRRGRVERGYRPMHNVACYSVRYSAYYSGKSAPHASASIALRCASRLAIQAITWRTLNGSDT